jgi:hypothetical protein
MALAPATAASPAQSDVPLALWPCAQPDPHEPTPPPPAASLALLPAQLARRIITEYTRPGDLLVGPACPALLGEAARLGRHAIALSPEAGSTAARQTSELLDLTVPAQLRLLAQVRSGHLTDPEVLAALAGQAHLLVIVMRPSSDPAAAADPSSLAAAAVLLRPGGLLVAVTRNQQHTGRHVDLAVATIRAAEQAGFAYLQHVVALLAPVQAGQLQPRVSAWQRRTLRARLARGERAQLGVHADVLAFAAPEAADA